MESWGSLVSFKHVDGSLTVSVDSDASGDFSLACIGLEEVDEDCDDRAS